MSDFKFRYHNFPKKLSNNIRRIRINKSYGLISYQYFVLEDVYIFEGKTYIKRISIDADIYLRSNKITTGRLTSNYNFNKNITQREYPMPNTLCEFKQLLLDEIKRHKMALL